MLAALRQTAAGSALVRELTAAPDLDGWVITERLLADLAPLDDRLWLVVDDVHELGGDACVAQPVGVDAGDAGGAGDDAADEAAVQRAAVVGDQPLVVADVVQVGGGPGGEQLHELGVQRDVAVVAELAQRDPQPVPGADLDGRVVPAAR